MTLPADIAAATEDSLSRRPVRSPDHGKESAALLRLAEEMSRSPDHFLQRLCEEVTEVCGAESAGVSLVMPSGDRDFHWPAVAGAWAKYVGGGMPRSASPCGQVLEYNAVLLFNDVHLNFPAVAQAEPPISEILLAPFHQGGEPIGTVWAIHHDKRRSFDGEDRRCLMNLAKFAAAAYHMSEANRLATEARSQISVVIEELGHRLKNMLAMVMAIATQTLSDVTERDAIDAFQKRLQAMGTAHDVLIEQDWAAAPVKVIAEGALASLGQLNSADIDGPSVMLGPRSALSLSLILHELSTNAMKYGALSRQGRVKLDWHIEGSGDDAKLSLTWKETGSSLVEIPTRKGFGSRLIQMGIHKAGETNLVYAPEGLTAHFIVPLKLAQNV